MEMKTIVCYRCRKLGSIIYISTSLVTSIYHGQKSETVWPPSMRTSIAFSLRLQTQNQCSTKKLVKMSLTLLYFPSLYHRYSSKSRVLSIIPDQPVWDQLHQPQENGTANGPNIGPNWLMGSSGTSGGCWNRLWALFAFTVALTFKTKGETFCEGKNAGKHDSWIRKSL